LRQSVTRCVPYLWPYRWRDRVLLGLGEFRPIGPGVDRVQQPAGEGPGAALMRCSLAILLLAAGCGEVATSPRSTPPEILANVVADNPDNVLSAVVTAHVRLADSVAVGYWLNDGSGNGRSAAVVPVGDTAL